MKTIKTRHKEILNDTISPIGAFRKLRERYSNVSLFESSDYHSKMNSRSFVGVEPIVSITVSQNKLKLREGKNLEEFEVNDLESQLNEIISSYGFEDDETNDLNGFFGAFAYDSIPYFESLQFKEKSRFTEVPEIYLVIYRTVLVFDNFSNKTLVLTNALKNTVEDPAEIISLILRSSETNFDFHLKSEITSNETDTSFKTKVKQAKENVLQGDAFQIVLSRSFEQRFEGDDFEVYRQLRSLNPSPYMFYFDMEKAKLIGASPEAQFRLKDGVAEIHPIAGTVRKTGDAIVDHELSKKLAADIKENAEHIMLVDLARNDLNITCSDVKVSKLKEIQSFSHVIHMVSKVEGQLKDQSPLSSFIRSFPAGTLSGAPKYKAMQLIDSYENENRGFYGGAIGHISATGNVNMAIIIRSCLSQNKTLSYQAGAGIVIDSDPRSETQEVYNKTNAVAKAIDLANKNKAR